MGSVGLGSLVYAFWVAPRLWRVATDHNFYTTGDYLEFRYGTTVRCVAALLVGLGTLALLAGQLIAGAAILNALTGIPRWAGGAIGVVLAILLETVIGTLTIFYSLLVVTLFVPILGGLYTQRARSGEALAAIAAGVVTMFTVRCGFASGYRWLDPTLAGLLAASTVFAAVAARRRT